MCGFAEYSQFVVVEWSKQSGTVAAEWMRQSDIAVAESLRLSGTVAAVWSRQSGTVAEWLKQFGIVAFVAAVAVASTVDCMFVECSSSVGSCDADNVIDESSVEQAEDEAIE